MSGRVREVFGDEVWEWFVYFDRVCACCALMVDVLFVLVDVGAWVDVDVVFVGGGFLLFVVCVFVCWGVFVVVFDWSRVGVAYCEWNVSGSEFEVFVREGFFGCEELDVFVVVWYEVGICCFGVGADHCVRGVFDYVVDGYGFFVGLRVWVECDGVCVVDGVSVEVVGEGFGGVVVCVRDAMGTIMFVGWILCDAWGVASFYVMVDLVCLMVGGVFCGFVYGDVCDEVDLWVGDVFVMMEGVVDGC